MPHKVVPQSVTTQNLQNLSVRPDTDPGDPSLGGSCPPGGTPELRGSLCRLGEPTRWEAVDDEKLLGNGCFVGNK
jgi:hypothetical protein